MELWSLEVTFSEMLVSLGRLWTCLVPRGVQGADVVEMLLSSGSLLAQFWCRLLSKTVMFLRCFFRCFVGGFVLWILSGVGSTFERFLFFCCFFCEIVNL